MDEELAHYPALMKPLRLSKINTQSREKAFRIQEVVTQTTLISLNSIRKVWRPLKRICMLMIELQRVKNETVWKRSHLIAARMLPPVCTSPHSYIPAVSLFVHISCSGELKKEGSHHHMECWQHFPQSGKALDRWVMSKECRQCMLWRGKERTPEFNEWWEGHQHRTNADFANCFCNVYGTFFKGQLKTTVTCNSLKTATIF